MSLNKDFIKIVVFPHPFKAEKIFKEVERVSFLELFKNECGNKYNIENAVIIDKDVKIKSNDYEQLPKSDFVIIRILPTGGNSGSLRSSGVDSKIAGGLLVAAGILVAVFGPKLVGANMIMFGLSAFLGGVVLYNWNIDTGDSGAVKQKQSVRGNRNQTRLGEHVPILLGKHLIVPDNAALPYTTVQNIDQHLHQLFCLGYNDMVLDTSTFKIGDTLLSAYQDIYYEIKYTSGNHTYYPRRIIENSISQPLLINRAMSPPLVKRTNTNTHTIGVTLVFPKGIFHSKKEGGQRDAYVVYQLAYKSYNASTYKVLPAVRITRTILETVRIEENIILNNTTVGSPDYNDLRQYDVRVQVLDWGRQGDSYATLSTNSIDRTTVETYLESIKSYVGDYSSGSVKTWVINPEIMTELVTISMRIKASNQLNGVIDQFNCIGQTNVLDYNGVGSGYSNWSKRPTSNPASLFLYLVSSPHICQKHIDLNTTEGQDKIDWEALEAWHTFCVTKGFECNAYVNEDITLEDLLNRVCSTGRAGWSLIDGKYTIIIDTYKNNVVQYITPRNSQGFMGNKAFAENPTALDITFVDSSSLYVEATRRVFEDEVLKNDDKIQEVTLWGVTKSEQAWKLGRYLIAASKLRPETYSFNMSIEYLVATRGDRVQINHDVPMLGLARGRIKNIVTTTGNTTGFIADDVVIFEPGKEYGITIRTNDGTGITKAVYNPATITNMETSTIMFIDPITDITTLAGDDLYLFGIIGEETLDLIITSISPQEDLSAKIVAIPYSPEIFTADSGVIPEWNPMISLPGDSYNPVTDFSPIKNPGYEIVNNASLISMYNVSDIAIIAKRDASSVIGSVRALHPAIVNDEEIVYCHYDDGMKLYKKSRSTLNNGAAITSDAASYPVSDKNGLIYYVNMSNGNVIYVKNTNDISNGTALTTNMSGRIALSEDNYMYYINYSDDNKVYRKELTTLDEEVFLDFACQDIAYTAGSLIYVKAEGGVYYKQITPDNEVLFLDVLVQEIGILDGDNIFYIRNNVLYEKATSGANTDEGDPIIAGAISATALNGDIYYSNYYTGFSLNRNLGESSVIIEKPFLGGIENAYNITGDLVSGSNVVSNVNSEDMSYIADNDEIFGIGVSDGTKILFKGTNFFYMTANATITDASAPLIVRGSRIYLNANKVIMPGTIEAKLLSASAIDSKAKDPFGNPISKYNLDAGTQVIRKSNGDIVMDFNPSRVGSEMVLNGTLRTGSVNGDGFFDLTSILAASNWNFITLANAENFRHNGSEYDEPYSYTVTKGSDATKAYVAYSNNGWDWNTVAGCPNGGGDWEFTAAIGSLGEQEYLSTCAILGIAHTSSNKGVLAFYIHFDQSWVIVTSGTYPRFNDIFLHPDPYFNKLFITGNNGTLITGNPRPPFNLTVQSVPTTSDLELIRLVNNKMFICGDSVLLEGDYQGQNWKVHNTPNTGVYDIAYSPFSETYAVATANPNKLYATKDFITYVDTGITEVESVCFGNGVFIEENGGVSIDGVNWYEKYQGRGGITGKLHFARGRFISSAYTSSSDGIKSSLYA